MHLCFVPLTKDKQLSAKELLGNKKTMIRWQDDFYACMAERWPELERGMPAVEIKRRHLTPQWYKTVTAINSYGECDTRVFPGTMRCDNIDIFERTAATAVFSGRNALDSGRNRKACCLSLTANISGCTENHLLNLAHFFSGGISFLNRVKSASRTDISLVIILFLFKCFSKTLFDCINYLCSTRNCVNICDVVIGSVLTNQLFAHTRLIFCHIAI